MDGLHVPDGGAFCVPTALQLITGEDYETVIFPALNRHGHARTLTGEVAGAHMHVARKVLEELGWTVRAYKGDRLSSQVQTWAKRFPDRTILIAAGARDEGHCMVLKGGKIYDSWYPTGCLPDCHAYSTCKVDWAALVQR